MKSTKKNVGGIQPGFSPATGIILSHNVEQIKQTIMPKINKKEVTMKTLVESAKWTLMIAYPAFVLVITIISIL